MWLFNFNYNFACDWLIELSDNKLSNNKVSDNKLSDNSLTRQDKTRQLYLTRVAQSAAKLVSLGALGSAELTIARRKRGRVV